MVQIPTSLLCRVCFSLQVLGTGCAGTRCLAGWHAGMPAAVKELLRAITGDDMQREMAILRTVTHKNVVRYFTHAYSDASYHYLVLERCASSRRCCVRECETSRGPLWGVWLGSQQQRAWRLPRG